MNYPRKMLSRLEAQLARGKSVLLIGARQTGKTTLLQHVDAQRRINLMDTSVRRRYEMRPELLVQEIRTEAKTHAGTLLVIIDEIQKVPALLDNIQILIDEQVAQFVLTGSSARKLRQPPVNLLPGRVVKLHLDPLMLNEIPADEYDLENCLLYGTLPGIFSETHIDNKALDLASYVDIYLEEEIRAEALVRKVGEFSRFLELAAAESGYVVNMNKLSNDVAVSRSTLDTYFQILEDCLIVERITPVTETKTRRRLLKSNRYLFYDLGVRRLAANEGTCLPEKIMGHLFEQFVGQQLIAMLRQSTPQATVSFWQDSNGVAVDWVVCLNHQYAPIEVKWSDAPKPHAAKHCETFINEYDCPLGGFVVCQTPHAYQLTDHVEAMAWQQLPELCQRIAELS